MNRTLAVFLIGHVGGLLGWIDPLFIPLALAGPVLIGGIAAARNARLSDVVLLWVSAGLCLTWTDWVVNQEDVVFHLVLTVLMPSLAAAAFGLVRLTGRGPRREREPVEAETV
ncbi:MAG TPA: hypothetical protein VGE14_09850 [Marmoricola sp.]